MLKEVWSNYCKYVFSATTFTWACCLFEWILGPRVFAWSKFLSFTIFGSCTQLKFAQKLMFILVYIKIPF